MLSYADVLATIVKVDAENALSSKLRSDLCDLFFNEVNRAEQERDVFIRDGNDLDQFLLSQIEDGCLTAIQSLKAGHSDLFSVLYVKELDSNDGERAVYNAYMALDKLGKASGQQDAIYHEAYGAAIVAGQSESFAAKYAEYMQDEPWDDAALKSAEAFERAMLKAQMEGRSPIYTEMYATLLGYRDYNQDYCAVYAGTYEFARGYFPDEAEAKSYTDFFMSEYYDYSCKCDATAEDKNYYHERALAHVEGRRIEKELGIRGFTEVYIDQFLSLFDDFPFGTDDEELRSVNRSVAIRRTVEVLILRYERKNRPGRLPGRPATE